MWMCDVWKKVLQAVEAHQTAAKPLMLIKLWVYTPVESVCGGRADKTCSYEYQNMPSISGIL
jgi:hypothetical protein